jgi:hypothetical protein
MGLKRDAGLVRTVGTRSLAASTICIVIGSGHLRGARSTGRQHGTLCADCHSHLRHRDRFDRHLFCGGRQPHRQQRRRLWLHSYRLRALGGIHRGHAHVRRQFAGHRQRRRGLGRCGDQFIAAGLEGAVHALVIVAVVGGIAFVNIGGIGRAARLVGWATILKLAPLVIFVIFGAAAVHAGNYVPTEACAARASAAPSYWLCSRSRAWRQACARAAR